MGESAQQNTIDFWAIFEATKARYDSIAALYDLVSEAATGVVAVVPGSANDDYLSFARSGLDGSESYNRESLLQRMSELAKQMTDLDALLEKQYLRAVKSRAGIQSTRVGGCGPRFGRY